MCVDKSWRDLHILYQSYVVTQNILGIDLCQYPSTPDNLGTSQSWPLQHTFICHAFKNTPLRVHARYGFQYDKGQWIRVCFYLQSVVRMALYLQSLVKMTLSLMTSRFVDSNIKTYYQWKTLYRSNTDAPAELETTTDGVGVWLFEAPFLYDKF